MGIDWITLLVAGVFEWGWPVGLKLGRDASGTCWRWIAFAALCMVASGALLLYAQITIPMGTAYAVCTGIGAVGTFVLGLLLFSEPATLARFSFVGLILIGIIGLKLASASGSEVTGELVAVSEACQGEAIDHEAGRPGDDRLLARWRGHDRSYDGRSWSRYRNVESFSLGAWDP